MKLEKIVINGFKSFADKTEFHFGQPITAIVGPNGCGKSNVVDAIKWVLGSQSPKSLRSGQMTDVIFSGSGSRKPSGMAEVSLHFSDVRGLGIEQDELCISRRLFRSGESEYALNGKSCRLKDIRELFMDTGVGVSAYSIIEQGQIDQLLHASKSDRRVIFEEAAGISRFKAHKKEAQRKLERTEQNLLRLADIVQEVQKQLRSIKLQAGKARNYLEYGNRLKELRVQYSLSEYHKFSGGYRQFESQLGEQQEAFAAAAAEVSRCDAAAARLREELSEAEAELNRSDNALIASRSRIEQQQERIVFLKSRIKEIEERREAAVARIQTFAEQSRRCQEELHQCEKDLADNERMMEEKSAILRQREETLRQIALESNELQAQLEDEKSGILDIVRRTAQFHNEIQSLSNYRNNLSGQKTRLSGKAAQTEEQLARWLTEKAQYQTRLEEIQANLQQLQDSLQAKRSEMEALDKEESRLRGELAGWKEKRSSVAGELKILRDMEAKKQGLSETVKSILTDHSRSAERDYLEGILADVLQTELEYAPAVEAVLENRMQALLISRTGAYLADETLRGKLDSRIQILCLDRLEPFCDTCDVSALPGVRGRLVEFIRFESRYAQLVWSLFGKVLLVEDVETAMELSGRLSSDYVFVTPSGEVFREGNCLHTGPLTRASGLISRKSQIRRLEEELADFERQIQSLETDLQHKGRTSEHLARVCQDLRTGIYEANTERVDAESRLRLVEQNIKRLSDEQPVISDEIRMLEEEIRQSVRKEHDSRQKLEELEEINRQRSEQIAVLEAALREKRSIVETHAAELTELKVERGRILEQQKSIRQRAGSLQSQLQHNRMALEAARTEVGGSRDQFLQTERSLLATHGRLSELYLEKETAQRGSRLLRVRTETLRATQRDNEQKLSQARARQQEIEQQIHETQLQLSQIKVRIDDLVQRVREELQIDLLEAGRDFDTQSTDWQAVQEEIADLRARIERLGNVNVDAIEQQDELEKRYEFLSTQIEDLNKSKTQLEQLIDRINRESREKFAATFEEVRVQFQQIFRKLFGGGKADIFLENPDDLLESGIEIVARPPGKETRSISLLSGGEKSMTAIALLFAVFRSKPSPFCVLDEVDAALDEANNERFNLIVMDFKENSQFIIISHSKRTMSMADVLYGVTMQTQGVSKKISVQFESGPQPTDAAVA